ncbi:MAG: SRPBCC domain-containing protein [Planctomycetota bacterium]
MHDDSRGRQVRKQIETTATPRQVWDAWTDPTKLAQWFVDDAKGSPEVGTTFEWSFDMVPHPIPYQVVEAELDKRFVLALQLPDRPRGVLEIDIESRGGKTVIRLVNSGFQDGAEWDNEYEGIDSGWEMALATLRHYLENHFGHDKRAFLLLRPTPVLPDADRFYRDEAGLAQWLTESGVPGSVGSDCRLVLRDGGSVTGTVLAQTAAETAIAWSEGSGVLELKGFWAGAQAMACIRGVGWGWNAERAAEWESAFTPAVERLAAVIAEDHANAHGQ